MAKKNNKQAQKKKPDKAKVIGQNTELVTNTPLIVSSENQKRPLLKRLYRFSQTFIGRLFTLASILGLTFKFLPSSDIILKKPVDSSQLEFELTNNSWIPIKNIETYLLIESVRTSDNDSINNFKFENMNSALEVLRFNDTHSFDYDFRNILGYDIPFRIFSAKIAVAVKYTILGIQQEDYKFYNAVPNFNGTLSWNKAPTNDFAEKIENDTVKKTFEDLPFFRRLMKSKIPRGPMPAIPKIDT